LDFEDRVLDRMMKEEEEGGMGDMGKCMIRHGLGGCVGLVKRHIRAFCGFGHLRGMCDRNVCLGGKTMHLGCFESIHVYTDCIAEDEIIQPHSTPSLIQRPPPTTSPSPSSPTSRPPTPRHSKINHHCLLRNPPQASCSN
jgi:hypothetical protein